jgi:hypothetical protein
MPHHPAGHDGLSRGGMDLTYLTRLEAHLGERYSPHTRRAFLGHARRFLDFAGVQPSYGRENVLAYVDRLILEGFKEPSIRAMLTGIRVMFDVNGLTWPLERRDLRLGLPQEDPLTPTLTLKEVGLLIRGTRETPGFPRTVVALASIFGLRGDEIIRALAAGCSGEILEVQTAKGGRKRRHHIPERLRPVLTFSPSTVSARSLHNLFESLMRHFVRPPRPREGWHAVRRSVVTGLFGAGLSEEVIHRFMGWKSAEKTIAFRYFHPDPTALDLHVYRKHPYLPLWIPSDGSLGGVRQSRPPSTTGS